MKMTRYFICCEKCFEAIGKRSTRAAKMWMDVCTMRLQYGQPFRLKTARSSELRILETMGFLVSTDEEEDCIAVRVNGHMTTEEDEHFFCIKGGKHE